MSKPSPFPTGIKVFYSLHLLLTILSIGGILYLVFSLRETQNELKDLKESCAFCDLQKSLKTESDTSSFKKTGQDDLKGRKRNEGRKRRELDSSFEKWTKNQTFAKMIEDFMKLLEVSSKLVCIN